MENIAKIKLAPGKVGFYDHLSNIHLTLGSPTAYVPSGTNCAALRRNLRAGLIELLEGSLGRNIPPFRVEKTEDGGFRIVSNEEEVNKPVYKDPFNGAYKEAPSVYLDEKEKNGPEKNSEGQINEGPPMGVAVAAKEVSEELSTEDGAEETEEEIEGPEGKTKRKRTTKKKD